MLEVPFGLNDLEEAVLREFDPNSVSLGASSRFGRYRRKPFEGGDVAELFHENVKFTSSEMLSWRQRGKFDEDVMTYAVARSTPRHPSVTTVQLPEPGDLEVALGTVLGQRRSSREFAGDPLSLADLGAVLGHSAGVTETRSERIGSTEVERSFRAYPSGGGLYPVELYVTVTNVEGVEPGTYAYVPGDHELRLVSEADGDDPERQLHRAFLDGETVETASGANVAIHAVGTFWRSKAKYGPLGYQLVLLEAGHVAQNVLLVATARELAACPISGFDDHALNDLLGVDGTDEAAVYSLVVGTTEGT